MFQFKKRKSELLNTQNKCELFFLFCYYILLCQHAINRNEVSEMSGLTAKWSFTLSTSGFFLYIGRILTNGVGSPRENRLSENKTCETWKLFLHRFNSVKALRHQKATNGSLTGCRMSQFKRNISYHAFILIPKCNLVSPFQK